MGAFGVPGAVVICTTRVDGQEQLRKTSFIQEPTPEATARSALNLATKEQENLENERIIVCTVTQESRRKHPTRIVLPFKRNGKVPK